jgi:hypothetical protein
LFLCVLLWSKSDVLFVFALLLLLLLQVMGEAVLSPAIPSVAARAGGIFFPLAKVRTAGRQNKSKKHREAASAVASDKCSMFCAGGIFFPLAKVGTAENSRAAVVCQVTRCW